MIDGILAGEGQGPFCPTSKFANTILAGEDLLAVDVTAARYMGLNPLRIKYLNYFLENAYDSVTYDNISVYVDGKHKKNFFDLREKYLDFSVVDSWKDIKI